MTPPQISSIDLSQLKLNAVTTSQRGARSSPITYLDGSLVKVKLAEGHVRTPFGASSWEPGASRQNIDVSLQAEAVDALDALDRQLIDLAAGRSEEFFKKSLSRDQVQEMYKSSVTHPKKGDYAPTCRLKFNATGGGAMRVWGEDKCSRSLPEDLRTCDLTLEVQVRSIWFMSGQWGTTFEVQDMMVLEREQSCPF